MKNNYKFVGNAIQLFSIVFLIISSFFNTVNAQTYSKSILVNLGSNTCASTTPYISLIDKSVSTNPILLNCNISSTVSTYSNVAIEYNAKDNFIYLAKVGSATTEIFRYDVGLASQNFVCPTLSSTPTYTYNYGISNFSIDQAGDVYTISNYNATTATATFTKITLSTGAILNSQTVQFPTANKPTSFGNSDITFVANGKLYAAFQSATNASKLYEITNYGTSGTATAVFLKDIPNKINGLAFINDKLQLSGLGTPCYTYEYDIATGALSASSAYPNGFAPVDHTSIYTSIGSTKRLLRNTTVNSNTSDLEYELYLQNTGNVNLQGVQFTDDLAALFGAGNISNISTSIINNTAGLTLNAAFNGNSDKRLLTPGQNLTNLTTANSITIKLKLRVTNVVVDTVYPNRAQASAYVGTASNNITVSDYTNNGPPSSIYPLGADTLTPYYYLTPFVCSPDLYLSQYPNSGQASIFNLKSSTNPFTITNLDTTSTTRNTGAFRYNAIGYNTLDNFIYGINNDSSTNKLIQIDAKGRTTDLYSVSGLPLGAANLFVAGDTDNAGNLYVLKEGSTNQLYKIDIVARTATLITLSQTVNTLDFTYNKIENKFYGVDLTTKKLFSFTPTGTVALIGAANTYASFGAMYSGNYGKLFGNADDGSGFYQFNVLTGVKTLISSSIASTGSDGAHCVNSPISFASNLTVTKTDNKTNYTPGTSNTYTIVVSNTGLFGVQGVKVVDNVPAGIPTANVTYTAVVSNGGATNVIGTQTGNISDFVDLPVNGSVTYTIVLSVPLTFTGNLINTVTVTPPTQSTDQTVKTANDLDTIEPCFITASNPDTDNDGIANFCDLDDDNDGILDVEEGAVSFVSGSLSYEFYDTNSGNNVDNIPTTGAVRTGNVSDFDVNALADLATPGDSDTFSIRYTGSINIATVGNYTFYTTSDDGSKLFIDGIQVVNNNFLQPPTERSGNITLTAGFHTIKILFYENNGGEVLEVRYSSSDAGIAKTLLPFSILNTGQFRDTDGDGIPDHLDVDSDNDGCPDAGEGSEKVSNLQIHSLTLPTTDANYADRGRIKVIYDGSTAGTQANIISKSSAAFGVPQLVNNAGNNLNTITNPSNLAGVADNTDTSASSDVGQGVGFSANASISGCLCYNDANTARVGVDTKYGITLLQKAGTNDGNWPMIRKSAHTVLESNSKGFVITRMTTAQVDAITLPQDGMMVFDTTLSCLKLYDGVAWSCFKTPTCP